MMKVHVLDVLSEAAQMSTEELDHLMREKKDDVVVSLQKENVRIGGEEKVVRRVFVRTSSAVDYATVGWVMNEDIDKCMTCSKDFWFFHSRKHCHACGNINCGDCVKSFCLVEELPDQTHGVPVCSHCYWGQEPVTAWHRKGVDDLQAVTSQKKNKEECTPKPTRCSEHSWDKRSNADEAIQHIECGQLKQEQFSSQQGQQSVYHSQERRCGEEAPRH
jgi:hypothetical protein